MAHQATAPEPPTPAKCGGASAEDMPLVGGTKQGEAGSPESKPTGPLTLPSAPTVVLSATPVERSAAEPLPVPRAGDRVGHYRLLEEVGSGGFGTVWMAEQEGPVPRKVALKVIKLGMDTQEVIERFKVERQHVALMDHPSIAKVFDAGSTDAGRPFFVMELVQGDPITRFCDNHKLSIDQRLTLFAQVCRAVQHAHQKGVIHRDLKPTNIMVAMQDGTPEPKVIDFGIARATQGSAEQGLFDSCGDQMVGTPVYMSPEQAAGDLDADTRCDVYSLGMLLYELLTGQTAFNPQEMQAMNFDEVRQIICHQLPEKPSAMLRSLPADTLRKVALLRQTTPAALIRRVEGDPDWMVMKALEKDRARRYDTANGLVMDIGRHLQHEPIAARPAARLYRAGKAFRRHRFGFLTTAVVAVVLLVGSAFSIGQAIRATRAELKESALRSEAQSSEARAFIAARQATESQREALRDREVANRSLALAQLALAEAAYREQDGRAMLAALGRVPEGLRDSNWHYLNEKADSSTATLRPATGGNFLRAVPCPDRPGVFALGSADHTVTLVDCGTGAHLLAFPMGFEDRTRPDFYMAASPEGTRIAIGKTNTGIIALHSARDGKLLSTWETGGAVMLEFSPDGRHLLEVQRSGHLALRDASTGRVIWSLPGGLAGTRAAFTPDGASVFFHRTSKGPELALLHTADGTVSRPLPAPRFNVTCLAVSPDGKTAATGDQRGFTRSLDLATGGIRFEFRADDHPVTSLVFADAGRQLVTLSGLSGGRHSLQVWDASTGVLLEPLLGGSHADRDLSVHPRSGELIRCGTTAKVWKLNSRRENLRLAVRENADGTAFWGSEDFIFAQGSRSPLDILDLRNARPQKAPLWEAGERQRLVTVSAEGTVAALAAPGKDATPVQILHRSDRAVEPAGSWNAPGGVAFMRLSPDGGRLLLRSPGALCIVTATTGERQTDLSNRTIAVPDALWAGNDRVILLLAARNSRGLPKHEDRLAIHDAGSGQRLLMRTSKAVITAIATSPDGRMLADAAVDRVVRLRNAATLEVTREIRAHDGPIMALAFHPGGEVLATASEDLTVKLWDLSSGRLIEKLQGPVGPPKALVFSPDGRRIACLASDRTLRIWDTGPAFIAARAGGS